VTARRKTRALARGGRPAFAGFSLPRGAWLWAIGAGVLAWFMLREPGESDHDDESTQPGDDLPPFPALEVEAGKYLATDAAKSFMRMRDAAKAAGISLPISTAWRDPAWQQRLYDAWQAFKSGSGPTAAMAAKPGTSLHEKGIALDLSGINPAASNYNAPRRAWLLANAATYNWYNTGAHFRNPEPWHWAFGVQREGV
jgi:D-alanyl-D-alanine carboxypeptidase